MLRIATVQSHVLCKQTRWRFPFVEVVLADAGYQDPRVAEIAQRNGTWPVEVIKNFSRSRSAMTFFVNRSSYSA
jgi:hypothetical protein